MFSYEISRRDIMSDCFVIKMVLNYPNVNRGNAKYISDKFIPCFIFTIDDFHNHWQKCIASSLSATTGSQEPPKRLEAIPTLSTCNKNIE